MRWASWPFWVLFGVRWPVGVSDVGDNQKLIIRLGRLDGDMFAPEHIPCSRSVQKGGTKEPM